MPTDANNLAETYPELQPRGIRGLRFTAELEDEFRAYFSQSAVRRARLMPSFAAMMTVVDTALRLFSDTPQVSMLVFNLAFFLPLLGITLYASTRPAEWRVYQLLLTASGLVSGLVVASLVFRPSLAEMPSYFSMEVAWIFGIWLILGLRFRAAAVAALGVSASHVFGVVYGDFALQVAGYETVMLVLVNGIGAIACYQHELALRVSFVEAKKLEELAQLDGLTSLHNRRSFDTYIDRVWRQAEREQAPLTLLLVDIDHFKPYNDHYGHQAGDDALRAVATVVSRGAQRPFDFAARYGGEEFILAQFGSGGESGRKMADNLRAGIRALAISHESSPTDEFLTASVGVAVIMPDAERSLAGAIQMADEALYQAKEQGRNCVVVTESGSSTTTTGVFRRASGAAA